MNDVLSTDTPCLCPVNSYNEWDPLEEVIVGRLDGAVIPTPHVTVTYNVPPTAARLYRLVGGRRYPRILTSAAQEGLDQFIQILNTAGVTVRRPDVFNLSSRFRTPFWSSKSYCIACPRDGFLVVGNEIIETPMAWRSRFFEAYAYRALFKEYFAKGAKWTAAPRPQLLDDLYDNHYKPPQQDEPQRYIVNDFEPVFDAADFVRCGRDLFCIRSNVTNPSGITWLRRHLGETYRIHELESRCRRPMHIDSSFVLLAPGKVLINPEYIDPDRLPPMFKSWEICIAPPPDPITAWRFRVSMCSPWISVNVLALDEKRVIVEQTQHSLIKALAGWGCEPIPCPFANYAPFGGSFHCATLDIRRRGTLESYF
jgi:glycine amidinotransferase